jgi:xanthine dehydrogenase accessory factor
MRNKNMSGYESGEWRDNLKYKIRLRIYRNELVFGPGVAELLEHVKETGSLSEGCRKMGMAYSKGWKIIKRAEEDLGFSLAEGTRGGAHGGKMVLTEDGEKFIECYRKMDTELHKTADGLFEKYFFENRYSQKGETLILVRGGGDLATGVVHKLWSAGYKVVVLETKYPAAIRRQVSLCEAVYEGKTVIEGMEGVLIKNPLDAYEILENGQVPILVDPEGKSIDILKPDILIDAILAKVNLGTTKDMAGLTIALGPGFSAGEDVDFVIETKRGHNLGRIISKGTATPNTGIPGNIGGYTKERVIHALAAGTIRNIRKIGDVVQKGEPIAYIENGTEKINVNATITGIIRGLIRDGYPVTVGFKIADIDPRQEELSNCFTISDKARCIAGSVLELVTGYVDKKRGNTL